MADQEEAPGPSRQDKGKAKVGEPSDLISSGDDDQTDQRYEPGPGFGDYFYSALGPLMDFCLSKTLTSHDVNPKDPVLYLDAFETSFLIDSVDIVASPNSASFSKKLNIFDVHHQFYRMLLSHCVRDGWTGYSITKGWGIFIKRRNLVAGDEISFYRSRDIDSCYRDYTYVLTNKSDKLECFTRFKAMNYDKSSPRPRGPGSRYMPKVARCLSKKLTSVEVDEQYPRLNLTANDAFLLTCRAEILDNDPERFSEDLVVFDEFDNRYSMNISNEETGSPTRFFINTGWEIYISNFGLKEGDDLEIYRFIDHKLVPGKFYYALRVFKKPRLIPSVAPEERYVLRRTLTSQDLGHRHPALYIDASEAYNLTKCAEILDPSSFPYPMMLSVYDDFDKGYNMLLSHRALKGYSISRGWGRFVRDHQLKAGDKIFFYRYSTGEEGVEPFYDLKYIRKEECNMTQLRKLPKEKQESPDCKRNSGPGSRGIPDPVIKLTKTLSAHQGNIPKLCFDTSEAWLLTSCPRISENFPLGTLLMSLLVYDEDDNLYDMVLTYLKREAGKVVCTLDGGWHRFVESYGLKASDEVTIYRIQGEPYYALRYTRAGLPGGSGASVVGPSGSGEKEA